MSSNSPQLESLVNKWTTMNQEPPAVARLSKLVFALYRWAGLPLPETIEFVNLVQCIRLVCASSMSPESIAAEFNIRESIMYRVSTYILGVRSVRHCCDWSEIRKFEPRRLLWESIEERQQARWNEAFTIAKTSLENEGMSDFMWQKASQVLSLPQPLVAPFALLEQIHPRDEISMPDRVLGFELATQVPFLWTFANVAIVCTPSPLIPLIPLIRSSAAVGPRGIQTAGADADFIEGMASRCISSPNRDCSERFSGGASDRTRVQSEGFFDQFLKIKRDAGDLMIDSCGKKLVSSLFLVLVTGFSAPHTQAENADAGAKSKLLGKHMLSLQWILFDKAPFGSAVVKEEKGTLSVKGQQKGIKGDYLQVDGVISDVSAKSFKFEGAIKTKVRHINKGQECVRKGKMTFTATGNRKYWRLQEMNNPCDQVTDYVDVYFK